MGKILTALKDCALPLNTKKRVIRLDIEFSELESKVTILQTENLKLKAETNPLRRKLEAVEAKLALLNAPPHPDASSPEHSSSKPRPKVIMGYPGRRR